MTGGASNVDQTTNQVLPGSSNRALEDVANNFGLSSSAFQALKAELNRISPNLVINNNTSMAGLRSIFSQLGLHANGASGSLGTQPFIFSFQNLGEQFPGPAHFYSGKTSNIATGRWVLPVPPADFSVAVPNSQQSITTVSGFTYTHAGSIELDEVSFESFFPFVSREEHTRRVPGRGPGSGWVNSTYFAPTSTVPDYVPDYINMSGAGPYGYKTPREWVENLVTAMRANQPLIFSVYASNNGGAAVTSDSGMVIEPTAMSIASFDWNMGTSVGGTNRDVNYSITLKRWRRQSICITNYVNNPNAITVTNGSGGSGGGQGSRKYTTKEKDTLFKIAQNKKYGLGDGHKWRKIYNLNKPLIDKAYNLYKIAHSGKDKSLARFPLVPGMVLKMPRK
jgi:hypothetical protein